MSFPELDKKPADQAKPMPEASPENCSGTEWVIAYVKCRLERIFVHGDTRKKTEILKMDLERPKPVNVDLSPLGSIEPSIGRATVIRKLLFWSNLDVVNKHGTFSSANDSRLWSECQKMPPQKRGQNAMCRKLERKWFDAIALEGKFPVHFARNLEEMWKEKIRQYGQDNANIAKFYESVVAPYVRGERKFAPVSRKAYEQEVKSGILKVQESVDLEKWFQAYGITDDSGKRLALVLMQKLWATDLLALGMTEIMDKGNPKLNAKILDTILQYGWREYLMLIPAMGDGYVSYGPYQHTDYSIGPKGGATQADIRFTGGKILKNHDIMHMPFEDQHAAAYLLALDNIMQLVKKIPEKHVVTTIATVPKGRKPKKKIEKKTYELRKKALSLMEWGNPAAISAFFQYLAAAHNSPKKSREAFVDWLAKRSSDELRPHIDKDVPTARNNASKQRVNREFIAQQRRAANDIDPPFTKASAKMLKKSDTQVAIR